MCLLVVNGSLCKKRYVEVGAWHCRTEAISCTSLQDMASKYLYDKLTTFRAISMDTTNSEFSDLVFFTPVVITFRPHNINHYIVTTGEPRIRLVA